MAKKGKGYAAIKSAIVQVLDTRTAAHEAEVELDAVIETYGNASSDAVDLASGLRNRPVG